MSGGRDDAKAAEGGKEARVGGAVGRAAGATECALLETKGGGKADDKVETAGWPAEEEATGAPCG